MKKAFTLAEVLITIGIIGLVMAMTLPALVQNYQEKVTINRLKKVYSTLSQLYIIVSEKEGPTTEWEVKRNSSGTISGTLSIQDIFSRYIKKLQICTGMHCQGVGYRFLNGTKDGNSSYRIGNNAMILEDGTILRAESTANSIVDCNLFRGSTEALKNVCFEIFVDVNGKSNPNTFGRDVFIFYWTKNGGILPAGSAQANSSHVNFSTCSPKNTGLYSGYGCAAWVLYMENMDYLHCEGLSWDGKKSCKN